MDRQTFIKKAGVSLCGCTALLNFTAVWAQEEKGSGNLQTPDNEKIKFAHKWVKRFFDIFDKVLDEPTRNRIMEENGKECYLQAERQHHAPVTMEKFVPILQTVLGKENCRMEGNKVYFNYVGNPKGLKTEDGFCLCPLVENGPAGLSGTYCQCSVGYVKEMFSSSTGQKVEVELLESLKRNGKKCRFKIIMV